MDEPKNLLKCTCYLESLNKKREDTIESILKPRIATVNSCFDLFPCLRDPTRSSYPRVQFLAFSLDSNMSLSREAFYVVSALHHCFQDKNSVFFFEYTLDDSLTVILMVSFRINTPKTKIRDLEPHEYLSYGCLCVCGGGRKGGRREKGGRWAAGKIRRHRLSLALVLYVCQLQVVLSRRYFLPCLRSFPGIALRIPTAHSFTLD